MHRAAITTEAIAGILKDYNIGKKPFSRLLGWGDTTIMRYLDGINPTGEYSDKLLRIAEDPYYYYELLLEGKERISKAAFKKSYIRLQELFAENRLNLIAQYVINKAEGDISISRLQAVLYYAQGFSMALYNKEIFNDEYRIVSRGFRPYPMVADKMSVRGPVVIKTNETIISKIESELIDEVFKVLGWFGPEAIRMLTANERVYLARGLGRGESRIVSNEKLCRLFKHIAEQYGITKPTELYIYFNRKMVELRRIHTKQA